MSRRSSPLRSHRSDECIRSRLNTEDLPPQMLFFLKNIAIFFSR
jgi:hypothetical protein